MVTVSRSMPVDASLDILCSKLATHDPSQAASFELGCSIFRLQAHLSIMQPIANWTLVLCHILLDFGAFKLWVSPTAYVATAIPLLGISLQK